MTDESVSSSYRALLDTGSASSALPVFGEITSGYEGAVEGTPRLSEWSPGTSRYHFVEIV